MRLDAHQHFWNYDAAQYPWIPVGSPLHRDRLPQDLEPELIAARLDGSIAVQARQTLAESRWLLSLADASPHIRGVVGWVDLRSPDAPGQLAEFAPHPKFVGVRHVVQDEPDDRFMLQPDFLRGIAALREFDLAYDILIYPRQLPAALELVHRFPEQRFVLDHLAKPAVKAQELSPWREQIRELAQAPNLVCKISGLVTEADHHSWQPADFRPYLDVVFEAFSPQRLMFGSDWPVCLLAATYAQVYQLAEEYLGALSKMEQEAIFGQTAAKFYNIS